MSRREPHVIGDQPGTDLNTRPAWLNVATARLGPFSSTASTPHGRPVHPGREEDGPAWRQEWVWFLEHGREARVTVTTWRDRQQVMVRAEDRAGSVEWAPGPVPDRMVVPPLRFLLAAL